MSAVESEEVGSDQSIQTSNTETGALGSGGSVQVLYCRKPGAICQAGYDCRCGDVCCAGRGGGDYFAWLRSGRADPCRAEA